MYFFDFLKSSLRLKNITIWIYLCINISILGGTYMYLNDVYFWQGILWGLGAYILCLVVTLSPIGEWILRFQNGCKKIKRVEMVEYIKPIFDEVYAQAKQECPEISDDVKLYYSPDKSANAFALGRRTVCITEGMLQTDREELKAVLAHEMGHLAHKDTDLILVVSVGNFFVTAIIVIMRIIAKFCLGMFRIMTFFSGTLSEWLTAVLADFFFDAIICAVMFLWSKLGELLVMKASRNNEYEADEFSFLLGYGVGLCHFLDENNEGSPKGVFAMLSSSHPDSNDRIARLQQLGCPYRRSYDDMGYGKSR